MTKLKRITLVALAVVAGAMLNAATLELADGSRLHGELIKIEGGKVTFRTAFAGDLEIPQEQVANLQSDAVVNVRTRTGEVFQGSVVSDGQGTLQIRSAAGTGTARIDNVVSGWGAGQRDPEIVAMEAELEQLRRKWRYSLGFDLTGSDGNTNNFGVGLRFNALLEGPNDRLRFYGSYLYQQDNNIRSKDEQIVGVRYTNFFTSHIGWFVRQELERDTFEGVDFRSTSAAGLTYRFINEERMSLEGSAGFSYRYEDYSTPGLDAEGFPGLDLGLEFAWQFADWGRLNSSLSYIPSIEDFSEYLIEHESSIDMPLGQSDFWVLRLGVNNKFNSEPGPGRKDLDTTYFIRLLLTWD